MEQEKEKTRVRGRDISATGATVASNLKRLRGDMSLRELEATLERLKVKISASGLQKIESGTRRVDADEIIALSIALNVNPNALLLPNFSGDVDVSNEITAIPEGVTGAEVWAWADGYRALPTGPIESVDGKQRMSEKELAYIRECRTEAFVSMSRPDGEIEENRSFIVQIAEKVEGLGPGERLTVWVHSPEESQPAFKILELPAFSFTGDAVELERHIKRQLAGILREPSNAHYLGDVLRDLGLRHGND